MQRGSMLEEYVGKEVEVQIPEWLAKKHGYDSVYLEGYVAAETMRAIKLELCDGDNVWLPKNCIVDMLAKEEDEYDEYDDKT